MSLPDPANSELTLKPNIVILGAGLIGCYVGTLVLHAAHQVSFLGRKNPPQTLLDQGLKLTSYDGRSINIEASLVHWSNDGKILRNADVILVCVKSTATGEAGKLINRHCHSNAVIYSFQNGIGNAQNLQELVGKREVCSAMVGFNVIRPNKDILHFHKSTEGYISLQSHVLSPLLRDAFEHAGEHTEIATDIQAVLWGKLLLNLNNAVNVLSGHPLKKQLESRDYRKILAFSIEEALEVLKGARINPAQVGKIRASMIPFLLRLPDFLFKRVAGSMLKIDDEARSSMQEDFEAGKLPEIDFLNGAICDLGRNHSLSTPVNNLMVQLIKDKFNNRPDKTPNSGELLTLFEQAAMN